MAKLPISASENAQVLGFLFGLGFFFFYLEFAGRGQISGSLQQLQTCYAVEDEIKL